jgi:hypothetical protein
MLAEARAAREAARAKAAEPAPARANCPRCGRPLITKRDGIFRWRACRAARACGWTVFTHGQDERDKEGE